MEETDDRTSFEDGYDFNKWQLEPSYKKNYREIITKDVSLANLKTKKHFDTVNTKLSAAAYLNNMKVNDFVGWQIKTKKNPDGFYLEDKELSTALSMVKEDDVMLSAIKVFRPRKVFDKSVHNLLSKGYTLISSSRAIGGKAASQLITVRQEQNRTLKDQTERKSFFGLGKKSSSWGNYDKQKSW